MAFLTDEEFDTIHFGPIPKPFSWLWLRMITAGYMPDYRISIHVYTDINVISPPRHHSAPWRNARVIYDTSYDEIPF